MANKNLAHIDNCFFRLTAKQAKQIAVENKLPAVGHERKANLDILNQFIFGEMQRDTFDSPPVFKQFPKREILAAWIKRTRVNGQMVWAVMIHYQN